MKGDIINLGNFIKILIAFFDRVDRYTHSYDNSLFSRTSLTPLSFFIGMGKEDIGKENHPFSLSLSCGWIYERF